MSLITSLCVQFVSCSHKVVVRAGESLREWNHLFGKRLFARQQEHDVYVREANSCLVFG